MNRVPFICDECHRQEIHGVAPCERKCGWCGARMVIYYQDNFEEKVEYSSCDRCIHNTDGEGKKCDYCIRI